MIKRGSECERKLGPCAVVVDAKPQLFALIDGVGEDDIGRDGPRPGWASRATAVLSEKVGEALRGVGLRTRYGANRTSTDVASTVLTSTGRVGSVEQLGHVGRKLAESDKTVAPIAAPHSEADLASVLPKTNHIDVMLLISGTNRDHDVLHVKAATTSPIVR